MQQEWAWHRLVHELRSGRLEESARLAVERIGHAITVVLKAAEVVCPAERSDVDAHDFRIQTGDWHELQSLFDCGDLLVKHNQADPPRPGLFRDIERVTHLSDLPSLIDGIRDSYGNDHNWKWVDFYIGYHFRLAPTDDPDTWQAEAIWERICLAWDDWLWPKPK